MPAIFANMVNSNVFTLVCFEENKRTKKGCSTVIAIALHHYFRLRSIYDDTLLYNYATEQVFVTIRVNFECDFAHFPKLDNFMVGFYG